MWRRRTTCCAYLFLRVAFSHALPTLQPDEWHARLPGLQTISDRPNATADATITRYNSPRNFTLPIVIDGAEFATGFALPHVDGDTAPFEHLALQAAQICAQWRARGLYSRVSCADEIARAAETEWIEARRQEHFATLARRDVKWTADQYHFNAAFAHFERWLVSRRALGSPAATRVLELGSFEGGSAVWLADHVLSVGGARARLLCVDLWRADDGLSSDHGNIPRRVINTARELFEANVRRSPHAERVDALAASTTRVLAALLGDSVEVDAFDLVYVDAGHRAPDVVVDGALAFRLLRTGGIMAFDDYDAGRTPPSGCKRGIDAFLAAHDGLFELLEPPAYQLWLRKTAAVATAPY